MDLIQGLNQKKYQAMKVSDCPAFFIDNDGLIIGNVWPDLVLNKYKLYSSLDDFYDAAQNDPKKAWKNSFKILKKEKCLKRGVMIGGKHMEEYMPQFINFFKENLL